MSGEDEEIGDELSVSTGVFVSGAVVMSPPVNQSPVEEPSASVALVLGFTWASSDSEVSQPASSMSGRAEG